MQNSLDQDFRSLYSTGYFENIRVQEELLEGGVKLTYVVQERPLLSDLKFTGNTRFSRTELLKKLASQPGQRLNQRHLFMDGLRIERMYRDAGLPNPSVKYWIEIDGRPRRGSVRFEISENPS